MIRSIEARVRLAAPNAITLLAMFCGLTAIRLAIDARFAGAAAALAIAGLLDRLDGATARLLGAATRFGAELDSFADVVSFGVAPAFLMYLWTLGPKGGWGFLPGAAYAACAALRLARFNLASGAAAAPEYARHFYVGMTSPPAAAIALFPLLAALEADALGWPNAARLAHAPVAAVISLLLAGTLMISPLPLLDFVHVRVPIAAKLVALALFALLLAVQPWLALMGFTPFALFMLAVSPSALDRRRAAAIAGSSLSTPR